MTSRLIALVPFLAAVVLLFVLVPGLALSIAAFIALMVLPGWAISMVLLRPDAARGAARFVAALGLGLAGSIVVGVLVSITPLGTNAARWVLLALAVVSVVAIAVRGIPAPRISGLDITGRQIAMMGVATLLAVGAFGLSRASLAVGAPGELAALWMVPQADGSVRVGVTNEGGTDAEFRLVLSTDDGPVEEWPSIVIASGGTWEELLPQQDPGEIRATLYQVGEPGQPYREVVLANPPNGE